jgi:class 3 adenylate cyclase
VLTVVSGVVDYYLSTSTSIQVPVQTISVFFAINFAAMSSIIYFLLRYFVVEMDRIKTQLDEQHQLLAEEQKKSERVLLNVLPSSIANRLKNNQGLIADGHADVTVMFADLVNFTQLTESLSPDQMVSLLNIIFSGFDELSERYQVEKIKTIGDAYMVVGGLNGERTEYTSNIAKLALEMREFVANHAELSKFGLGIHTGIATGPVVAGVIGTKRFIYDLWGDTVNIASRITDEAIEGVIQVDKTTYKRIRNEFAFEPPVTVSMKGKGDTQIYRLTSRLTTSKLGVSASSTLRAGYPDHAVSTNR